MANVLFDKAREKFLLGELHWVDYDIKAVLCTNGYSPDLVNDEFLSDIPSGAVRVATTPNLSSKTSTAGVADAADVVLSSVSGSQVVQIVLYRDTGVEATSPLIALLDTATGLPVTPNGNDITLQWDNGANKIFKL